MRTATLIDPRRVDPVRIAPDRQSVPPRRANPHRRPGDNRPVDNRPLPESAAYGPRISSTRCASPVGTRGRGPLAAPRVEVAPASTIRRRRRTTAAILAGVGLALSVWVLSVVGQNYAASVTPPTVGTEVVHVRSGDSLNTIAARVAPDLPREAVVEDIVRLNDLPSSGLRVGQPLLAPRYS